jgi:hypothetical protein
VQLGSFASWHSLSRMDEIEVPQEMHDDDAKHSKTDDAENGAKPWSNGPIAYSASSVSPSPSSDSASRHVTAVTRPMMSSHTELLMQCDISTV